MHPNSNLPTTSKRKVRVVRSIVGYQAVHEAFDQMERSSRRREAIRRVNQARQKYAGRQKRIVNEIYPAGPTIGKNQLGVKIVATRDIQFEEPKFG